MEEPLSIIREDGSADERWEPDLRRDQLESLYRFMLLERVLDERMLSLQRQGRIGFYGPAVGQEATIVAGAFAMEPQDWIFPQYREVGAALLRGLPLKTLVCQFMGNSADLSKGHQMPCHFTWREGRFVSISSVVGPRITQAFGAAWAAKIRKDDTAMLAYFGDGATSTGEFHTAMNFAGVFEAPVVFLCNNNQYAISVPFSRQTAAASVAVKAKAYGFEGVRVDGMDALAVYSAVRSACLQAHEGGGPTLIEALTYRLGPHSSSDDPSRYRDHAEFERWQKRDPLVLMRRYLAHKGIWDEEYESRLREALEAEISVAVREAEQHPAPAVETLFEDLYEVAPSSLTEQREDTLKAQREIRGR